MSSGIFQLGTSQTAGHKDEASCFDCNICLEPACDPVVTFCGHLYCWPCICKWSQARKDRQMMDCPVCRNAIDMNRSLIPLYGRGHSSFHKDGTESDIPPRPSHAVLSRAFGADTASNPCFVPANGIVRRRNGRWRREEQKLERSLNRVSVFLLCCAVMCLLLF